MATPTATPPQTAPEAAPQTDPAPGSLAQILAPVEPARPRESLGSTASLAQEPADAGSSGSASGNGKGSGRDETRDGPIGALVRALATRLGRTGTATTVRQSHAITETRVSGSSSTHAGKSDRSSTAKHENQNHHRSNRDAKLADLNNKVNQHHGKTTDARTKGDTRTAKADTSAKSSRDNKDHRDGRTAKNDNTDAKTSTANTKNSKNDNASKNDRKSGGTDTKTSDTKTTRADVPATTARDAGPFDTTPTKRSKNDGPDGRGPAKDPKSSAPKVDLVKTGDTPSAASKGTETDGTAKGSGHADKTAKPDPKGLNTKVDLTKKQDLKPEAKTGHDEKPARPRPRTQPSRVAGYRDGHRAGTVAGHVQAWRDGTRDGWDDRQAANQAERKRMDAARARNAIRPDGAPEAPKMSPASGTTADMEKKPQQGPAIPPKPTTPPTIPTAGARDAVPAQVTAIGEKAIQFTADGAQHSMSRGEVRTLKQFERRLADKQAGLGRIAEGSKNTRALAVDLATRAQRLAEDAKAVKGGTGVVTVLLRLAERAQLTRSKAEEIEKCAQRGAEAVKVLAANADTRHGGIYKAIVDSPLTSPAEREFYQDKQGKS